MLSLNEQLKNIISSFYQNEISSTKAAYYITDEYLRLLRTRAEAEQNNQVWLEILAEVRKKLPQYAVRDFTNLVNNSCYEGELLLHKDTTFLDDDKKLAQMMGGTILLLHFLISVLGPYYYLYVEEMKYEVKGDKFNFRVIEPKKDEHKQVIQTTKQIIENYDYIFLERDLLKEIVPDLTTEFHDEGEVSIFHCIFSDFMDSY